MNRRTLAAMGTALIISGCSAATQLDRTAVASGPGAGMHDMSSMNGMMTPMMQPTPAMLLRQRELFGLTPEQVRRIEEIDRATTVAHQQSMHAAMQTMSESQALLDEENPDFVRYEAMLLRAAERHVEAHVTMARAWAEARAVLTPGQRAKVELEMDAMRQMEKERMEEMMGRGMLRGDGPRHDH